MTIYFLVFYIDMENYLFDQKTWNSKKIKNEDGKIKVKHNTSHVEKFLKPNSWKARGEAANKRWNRDRQKWKKDIEKSDSIPI